jgi:hypothetical protein
MSKKPIKEFLTKIQDSLEIIKQAKPLEIVAVLVKDYGFLPKDACKTTANLIKQATNQSSISDTELHELYLSAGGDYPITKQHRFHSEKDDKKKKKYKFYNESKIDFTPRDQQIINRWEFPPEPVGKQTKWPYAAAQIDAMKPKNKARRGGLGGGTFESAKEPLHQIRMGPGKRVRKKGGDWGGSQGIQSMPTPHAKDNPTSTGNVISTTGAPGWSKSLPNKEFEPPINNFLSGEREREKVKKYKFKKLETKALDEKQRFEKEKGEKFESKYIAHFYKKFKGKNDPLLFAHFTGDIPKTRDLKIGLNPRSDKSVATKAGQTTATFNTPLGIYAYPVFAFEEEDLEMGFVPFGGHRKNIVLFTVRPSSRSKIIVVDDKAEIASNSPINQRQAEEILEKTRVATKGGFRDWSDEANFQTTVGKLWNITRMLSNKSISAWAKILRDLGVEGIVDMGSGMIHDNEEHQAVFFGKDIIQVLGVDRNQGASRSSEEDPLVIAIDSDDPRELHKIAKKGDFNVGARVFLNKSTNYDTMLMLIRKWGEEIYRYAFENKNLDPRLILQIAKRIDWSDKGDWRIIAKVFNNPNTPKEVFSIAAQKGGANNKSSLAAHPNTPIEILKQLVNDENEGVRILAKQYLKRRTGKAESKKIKRYKFSQPIQEKVIYEISEDEISRISDYLGDIDKLSFNNIFGNKKRMAIPFSSTALTAEMQDIVDFFQRNGYQVDLGSGMVEKEFEIPAGPKKGQKQKRKEKIGKALSKVQSLLSSINKAADEQDIEKIKKLGVDINKNFPKIGNAEIERYQKVWNKQSAEARKYFIVLSRHPIDVLRMSDFQGIQSCHSVGGSYYQCAVQEAKGNGLMAYLVSAKDVPKDFDWDQDEVFRDKQRDIKGLEPISRVKLRKYVNKKDGSTLAAPELRVYGQSIPGFVDKVVQIARETQKLDLEDKPDMDDYIRHGGSDQDSTDGEMFNQIYGTDEYKGYTDKDTEGEDQSLRDQYVDQCNQIEDQYNRRMDYSSVSYSINDDGEQPHVMFSAQTYVEIDALEDIDLSDSDIGNLIRKLNTDYSIGEYGAKHSRNRLYFEIEDYTNEFLLDPEGFENFADFVENQVDNKNEELTEEVLEALISLGLLGYSEYYQKLADAIDTGLDPFDNFNLECDSSGAVVRFAKDPVIVKGSEEQSDALKKIASDKFQTFVKDTLIQYYKQYGKNETIDLPGTEKEKFNFQAENVKYALGVSSKREGTGFDFSIKFGLSFDPYDYEDEDIKSILAFAKFYDEQFDRFPILFEKIYQQFVNAATKQRKLSEIELNAFSFKSGLSHLYEKMGVDDYKYGNFMDAIEENKQPYKCKYNAIDDKSILLRSCDFDFVDDAFNKSGMTGPDFMKDAFTLLYKNYVLQFKENLQRTSPEMKKLSNLYLVVDKKFFENMPINLRVTPRETVPVLNGWRAEKLSEEDLNAIQPTLDNLGIQKGDVKHIDINGLRENKKAKTDKYDLSKIPEREKPQKVGQPLPVAGWTGGMDPLKKSGRKI